MTGLRRRWRIRARDEGAFTPMVAVITAGIFAMVGLAVDGGGRMRTIEHADNLAAEAARAGGQALDLPQAVAGTADVIDPSTAVTAAQAYLRKAGATGHVTVINGGRDIKVTVTITYEPVMLDLVGLGPWSETGTATAELLTR
jgi:Flp pilus assembly protein TadG